VTGTGGRKRDHLRLSLDADVHSRVGTGLDQLMVRARALPEAALDAVDLSQRLWGRTVASPLLVSCMTGGVSEAGPVNRALALAAQAHGVALGLGSGRILLEDPEARDGFAVRDVAPDVLLLANLGAAQVRTHGPEAGAAVVAACDADALVVHLNAVQEAIQPGGDTDFSGVAAAISALCERLPVPVIVKEVGFGLAPDDVATLHASGVAGVDVAGAGGTNWARVEGLRDERAGRVASAFADWGWPTADAVRLARHCLDEADADEVVLIGSGGVRHGVDALKVLCLGARLAGVGRELLTAAASGPDAAVDAVGVLVEQLRVGAWAAGALRLRDLNAALLVER
jgi:isopentenyl-diphosphate Delta-isomerase